MQKRVARKRRACSEEFKAETVKLVRDSGKSVGTVARNGLPPRTVTLLVAVRIRCEPNQGVPGVSDGTKAERS
jgi:hypothetical protein